MKLVEAVPLPCLMGEPGAVLVDGRPQRWADVDLRTLTPLARWMATHWKGCGELICLRGRRGNTRVQWAMPTCKADETGSDYWNRVAGDFDGTTDFTVLWLGKHKYTLPMPAMTPAPKPELLPAGDTRYAW